MSSNINYLSINENYPVAGVDNDTQTLRDNFDTIKTSLRIANEEVTDLQDNVARTDQDANFNLNVISNAVLENVRQQRYGSDSVLIDEETTVDFLNGSYQIFKIGASIEMDFLNFPGDPELTAEETPVGMGKVTLELYSNNSSYNITFGTEEGTVLKCNGFPLAKIGEDQQPVALTSSNATNPVIIEVWRHSEETIFMHYIGQFL